VTDHGPDATIDRTGFPPRRYGATPATAPGPSGPTMLRAFWQIRNDPLAYLVRTAKEYGPIVQFPIPSPPSYLVADASAARHVLTTQARNYTKRTIQYSALSLVTGDGLLTSDGEVWRRQRRLVQPAFHHESIARVGHHVAASVARLDDDWERLPRRGAVVDVDEMLMRATLEIVGSSLFGTDLSGDAERLAHATLRALDVVIARARVPIAPPAWVPTPANRRLSAAVRELDGAVTSMLRDRRAESASSREPDMLDLLLAVADDGDALSPDEVRNQIVTFLVAGHETVASALSWAMWLIAGEESVQQRLHDEAASVLGDAAPSTQHVQSLPFARAVFDEALRLFPPAWLVTRRALAPDVLQGREIPAGALIIMSPYIVHRDPSVWERPHDFDPDRFMSQRSRGGESAAAFWPFGAGPRLCIGREFAYLEGVLLLAALARRIHIARIPGIQDPKAVPLVTIRPQGGVPLNVTRRV
jgi:cytochrome P450